jgi:hypothetical protein
MRLPDSLSPQPAGQTAPAQDIDPARLRRRQWRFLLLITLVVIAVVLGYKALRGGLYGLSAYNEAMTLRALRADGDLDSADLAQAHAATGEIYGSVAAMERELRFFAPLLRGLGFVPKFGPTLAAAPDLLAAGRELVAVANGALAILAPAAAAQPTAPLPELVLAAMATAPDQFTYVQERAAAASAALNRVPADRLIEPLAARVAQGQSGVALLADGLTLAPVLPRLLGAYGAQTYLILVQNNQELRATGGFISAVGKVTVNNGQIENLDFTDSYQIERNDVDHPAAPDPQQRYMDIHLVFLRDANWSPDFPTTAQLARSLYAQDAGIPVDGLATVDLRAVELLIGALGPLQVEGADAPVTGDNIIEQVQRFWDQPLEGEVDWWNQRKDFMPILAQAALDKLKSGNYDPLALPAAVEAALDERAVQVWMVDPAAAELFAGLGWDGALQPEDGADYVSLIDTNMGYNKVNAVMQQEAHYAVAWPDGADAPAEATLTVTYTHPLEVPGYVCDIKAGYGAAYADMLERCYFNYVRLYAPAGSELIAIDGVEPDSVSSRLGERGTQVMAGYFAMLPGTSHTVTFRYRLPPALTPETYRVVVQRQSGAPPLPLTLQVGDAQVAATLTDSRLVWAP